MDPVLTMTPLAVLLLAALLFQLHGYRGSCVVALLIAFVAGAPLWITALYFYGRGTIPTMTLGTMEVLFLGLYVRALSSWLPKRATLVR
jgi:hypothetical protein